VTYLFGDSTRFPQDHDVLKALDLFLRYAGDAATRLTELRTVKQQLADAAAALRADHEGVGAVQGRVLANLRELFASAPRSSVLFDYARQLEGWIAQGADDAHRGADHRHAEVEHAAERQIERLWAGIRAALHGFVLEAELDLVGEGFELVRTADQYNLSVSGTVAEDIEVDYTLAVERSAVLAKPCTVADLVGPASIAVGLKRHYLSRRETPRIVKIDRYVIDRARCTSESMIVAIHPPGARDGQITLHIPAAGVHATRIVSTETDGEGAPMRADDIAVVAELASALRNAVTSCLPHRTSVTGLRIGGEGVCDEDHVEPFLARLVAFYAPIALAIAERSPSPDELSLKIERDDGRREELYVRRDALIGHVAELRGGVAGLFSPLVDALTVVGPRSSQPSGRVFSDPPGVDPQRYAVPRAPRRSEPVMREDAVDGTMEIVIA
jgi:hypothetical protein